MGAWGYFEYPTEPPTRPVWMDELLDQMVDRNELVPSDDELMEREDGEVHEDEKEIDDVDFAYEQWREAREWGI